MSSQLMMNAETVSAGCEVALPNCSSCRQARQVMNISAIPVTNQAVPEATTPNHSARGRTDTGRVVESEAIDTHIRHDVEERDDDDPHSVDKMPVEAGDVIGAVGRAQRRTPARHHEHVEQHEQAHDDV